MTMALSHLVFLSSDIPTMADLYTKAVKLYDDLLSRKGKHTDSSHLTSDCCSCTGCHLAVLVIADLCSFEFFADHERLHNPRKELNCC